MGLTASYTGHRESPAHQAAGQAASHARGCPAHPLKTQLQREESSGYSCHVSTNKFLNASVNPRLQGLKKRQGCGTNPNNGQVCSASCCLSIRSAPAPKSTASACWGPSICGLLLRSPVRSPSKKEAQEQQGGSPRGSARVLGRTQQNVVSPESPEWGQSRDLGAGQEDWLGIRRPKWNPACLPAACGPRLTPTLSEPFCTHKGMGLRDSTWPMLCAP